MSFTSKGKRWELLHSLWIGWTFTLGFFNWIAFFYIAFRAKRKRWAAWGLLYSVPFVLAMIFAGGPAFISWIGDVIVALTLILGIAGIVHAFWIRKEYLLRLDYLQRRKGEDNELLKRRLATEYGQEKQSVETSDIHPTPSAVPSNAQMGKQGEMTKSSTEESSFQARTPQTQNDSPKQVLPQVAPASLDIKGVSMPDILSGDELEYRISSSYPFPLAFGFRSLASIVDPRDLYREQLRVAENVLAFLGSVSLALLREQDRERAEIDPKDYWLTGVSPGDWKEIVARSSKVFAGYEDDILALALKNLNIRSEKKEKSFGANVAALIRAKNDFKHDRGPVVLEDISDASRVVQERLRRCMEALSFSTDYPIRQVEDFDVARGTEGVILRCLRYMGDHPSFPQEEVPFERALPRGDLFLDRGSQGWIPLFPFMDTMTCSHCKARETYFIDAWDSRRGVARMKSFERGHTASSTEISKALAEWSSNVRPDTS